MYGSDYVWLLPERKLHFPNTTICQKGHVSKTLEGIITVSHYNKMPYDQKSISGLVRLPIWKNITQIKKFIFQTNKDFSKLLNDTQYSKFTYDAVWTMAVLLRQLQKSQHLNLSTFYYDQDDFVEHMLEEMKILRFMGASVESAHMLFTSIQLETISGSCELLGLRSCRRCARETTARG